MAKKDNTIWMCGNCGNEYTSWTGKCSYCGEWNTIKEMRTSGKKNVVRRNEESLTLNKLSEINISNAKRITTGISEIDRVLGGGIIPGSIILLGGEPGIGKSTLILKLADNLGKVIYLSAEESGSQIKLRSDRMGIENTDIYLISDWDIEAVVDEVKDKRPNLFIVDSIQTISMTSVEGTPGSVVQVRECGILLQQLAKSTGIPVIIIGHVTKEGSLAGPRILEHLVDTVLYLEGERFGDARILRGVKNRFGATNEVGIFSMQEKGLTEIKNPSELFLSEHKNSPGSVVAVTMEGTRPILVEIQALVVPTHFGYPKRTSSGFDLNRLNLLAAVISKKTNINLADSDIYLNVVGGIKASEPAVDLAVCAAIISSFKNRAFKNNYCFFGEIGLSGEVRKVIRQSDREKEAKSLGHSPVTLKEVGEIITLLN